jgi:hypothetical protein
MNNVIEPEHLPEAAAENTWVALGAKQGGAFACDGIS